MFNEEKNNSKKSSRPIKGYKWMAFTFFMIVILSLAVIFKDQAKALINKAKHKAKYIN